LPSPGGEEALRLSEEYAGHIDLLLTDVVMPGISGPEVFRQISHKRPGIKILYMSGYTGEAELRHGALEESTITEKPLPRMSWSERFKKHWGV
jgi:CheY-like chemotaxis protein